MSARKARGSLFRNAAWHGLRYGRGYARTTGRRDGLGTGGRNFQGPNSFPAREDLVVAELVRCDFRSAITDVTKKLAEMDRGGSGQFLKMRRPEG